MNSKLKPYHVFVVAAIGIGLVYVMSCGTESPIEPKITAPGGKIVYGQKSTGTDFDIYTINTDGSNRQPVLTTSDRAMMPHCGCRNGKIVFSWEAGGDPEIYTMNMDGSGINQLTDNGYDDYWPRWSPGDSLIAFHRYLGNWELLVMNPESKTEFRITNDAASDIHPSWSADGTKLVFQSNRVGGDYDLYVIDLGPGSAVETLTQNDFDDIKPKFSHNGEWIVFVSQDRSIDQTDQEIFKMRPDGSEVIQLTHNTVQDDAPNWSPDDSWIVFTSVESGNYDIFLMRADGAGLRNITNDTITDEWPDWTH